MSRRSKKSKTFDSSIPLNTENSVPFPNLSKSESLIKYAKANWLIILIIGFFCVGAFSAGLKYLEDDAKRQMTSGGNRRVDKENESFLNSINPFLPSALPNPTPQLAKEYIYAGSKLLSVEDAGATNAPPADIAVWRPSSGVWWVMGQTGSQQTSQGWGTSGDIPVQGDYDGDGRADYAIRNGANWIIKYSSNGQTETVPWQQSTDTEVQNDYDGDGKVDIAVWRNSDGNWYIRKSSTNTLRQEAWGISGDIPVPAFYRR